MAAAQVQPARQSGENSAQSPPSQPAQQASAVAQQSGPIAQQTSAFADEIPTAAAREKDTDNDGAQFGAALADVVRSQQPGGPLAKTLADAAPGKTSGAAAGLANYEPAKFQGIQPGKSTREELQAAWGQPAETTETAEGRILTFEIEPFQAVEVLVAPAGQVAAIKVTFTSGLAAQQLAKQLTLEEFTPVIIRDERGRALGEAFPERGVSFMFDAPGQGTITDSNDHSVLQVAIQSLDARAFALRAEEHLHGPYSKNIDDLKTAVALEPHFTHARWLLAEIYLATGQADLALAEATAALDLEPTNGAYQLRHGEALMLLGQYDDAVHEIRGVLDQADTSPVVRAQAMHEMAQLASLGDAEIAAKAISFDNRAIELADKLATSDDVKERRAAKRVLIEAHLAIAEEIARQSFGDKVESLQQWVGRASGLAEDYIKNEGGSVELRLIVSQRALAALASFKPTLDPAPWIAEAEEAATALKKESDDELWQQHIAWELGQAYLHALRTEHLRRETTSALHYGQLAIENMAEGAKSRQAVPAAEQLVGQLYFHVGAVYAVHQQDHKKATAWYDKAAPLLGGKRPASELYSPRRDGEMLVSMGVSYWQTGQQSKALELTEAGCKLVEQAVEDGILAKGSLAVPYGNLATMYQQVGEHASAKIRQSGQGHYRRRSQTGPADQPQHLAHRPHRPHQHGANQRPATAGGRAAPAAIWQPTPNGQPHEQLDDSSVVILCRIRFGRSDGGAPPPGTVGQNHFHISRSASLPMQNSQTATMNRPGTMMQHAQYSMVSNRFHCCRRSCCRNQARPWTICRGRRIE